MIFSSKDESDTIRRLLGDDAQAFIDVIDEARFILSYHRKPALIETDTSTRSIAQALDRADLPLRARKNCLRSMYRTCGRHALLPTTLEIPISYDQTSDPLYRGGFADVWKGEHRGRDIAVKVIRTHSNADFQKIIGVSC